VLYSDLVSSLMSLPSGSTRAAFLEFLQDKRGAALWKGEGQEHITASCFVFSPEADQVLLCFHRKGNFWVQLGGHLEPHDLTAADAALREAREESGLERLQLSSEKIADLDRHELVGAFTCAAHWDIGFIAIADPDSALLISDESDDLRWFPLAGLPTELAPGCGRRIMALRHAARTDHGTHFCEK